MSHVSKPSDFKGLSKRELRRRLAEATNYYFEDAPFNADMAQRLDLIQFLINPHIQIEVEDLGETREILMTRTEAA